MNINNITSPYLNNIKNLQNNPQQEVKASSTPIEEEVIVKRKSIELKPIDEDEAILQMELLGHNFFVYKDADTDKICVLYKRKNGNYGIIETK